eukprot:TRINITY_DN1375_c0_g1_i3.p1 TRINITY_DN1375_c0_g1~~TRINITY_DN1375_c0_g1_i3.p1  ORF type:complete len:130 (-),score=30.06 TRINITY_DN1375_c0_g1_i3:56-445(-)
MSPHVVSVDIVDRKIDTQSGKLLSERVMTTSMGVPSWMQRLSGGNVCFIKEKSEVDPKNKEMTLSTINVSFNSFLQVQETCSYSVHPENSSWTIFRQKVEITSRTFGVASAVEQWFINKYQETSQKVGI